MDLALIGAIIIQLLYEPLPVSSSGHVLLFTSRYPSELYYAYEGIFALPTIIAILLFFIRSWLPCARLIVWRWSHYGRLPAALCILIRKLGCYSCISVSLAVISYSLIKRQYGSGQPLWFLPYGFLITMVILVSLRFVPLKKTYRSLSWYHVGLIGCAQATALLPGISRLASTYAVCRWGGMSPRRSLEYSFLILLPLLCAAFLKDCITVSTSGLEMNGVVALSGLILGVGIELVVLQVTYRMAERHLLWLFGYYMILPCILSLR
jgi:undecaprenyl-diphosphatase